MDFYYGSTLATANLSTDIEEIIVKKFMNFIEN